MKACRRPFRLIFFFSILFTTGLREAQQFIKMLTAAASHAIRNSYLIIEVKINTNWNSINFPIREKSLNKGIYKLTLGVRSQSEECDFLRSKLNRKEKKKKEKKTRVNSLHICVLYKTES